MSFSLLWSFPPSPSPLGRSPFTESLGSVSKLIGIHGRAVYLRGAGPIWVFGITHCGHRRNGLDWSNSGQVAREEPGMLVGKE